MPSLSSTEPNHALKFLLATVLLAACTTTVVKSPQGDPSPGPAVEEPGSGDPDAAPALNDNGSLSVPQPAPERVVAFGDVHGDLDATRRVLRLVGAIDAKDAWIGGKLVVVQTGDSIDRGDDDRAIIDLIERLKTDAPKSGGQLIALVGNHEIMNTMLDFRYVTEGAFTAFADVTPKNDDIAKAAEALDLEQRGRAAAFLPGGPYATILSTRPAVARVGDTIFLHGGVLPKYAKDLDATNQGVNDWLTGKLKTAPDALTDEDGPLWARDYSEDPGTKTRCADLQETLTLLNAKRMVMGHTVQKGVSPTCDEQAWRIDVGMSSYYGGPIQALELRGDTVTVLKE